jgi:crotonobetainyl-CoA:carnitine CoA-transferase CaiB-like acyl-CoA transferase
LECCAGAEVLVGCQEEPQCRALCERPAQQPCDSESTTWPTEHERELCRHNALLKCNPRKATAPSSSAGRSQRLECAACAKRPHEPSRRASVRPSLQARSCLI